MRDVEGGEPVKVTARDDGFTFAEHYYSSSSVRTGA